MKKLTVAFLLIMTACSGSTTTTAVSPTEPDPTTTSVTTPGTTEPPAAVTTEPFSVEVVFPADGVDLAGTFRLPAGDQPAPGAILIHGSGPQSRESRLPGQLNMAFGFEIPVFVELAEALQANGVAVLTYDKRSCGPFNGCAMGTHGRTPT